MSDYLPVEVIEQIFYKLPIKTLGRFTSVCKSWYSLIKSPAFISNHLKNRDRSRTQQLFLVWFRSGRYALHFDKRYMEEYVHRLDVPPFMVGKDYRLIGSCNGLICLADLEDTRGKVLLWNPAIRKVVILPRLLCTSRGFTFCSWISVGFGYDSLADDYKVLYIWGEYDSGSVIDVEVYSLNSGSWKTITSIPRNVEGIQGSRMVFVKGSLHCIASRSDQDGLFRFILGFDLSREVFFEIMLPANLSSVMYAWLYIHVVRESSSIAVCECDYSSGQFSHMWVMWEYGLVASWMLWLNLSRDLDVFEVLAFRSNGEMILRTSNNGVLSWDPKDRQTKELLIWGGHQGSMVWGWHRDMVQGMICYEESLLLLDGDIVEHEGDYASGVQDKETNGRFLS